MDYTRQQAVPPEVADRASDTTRSVAALENLPEIMVPEEVAAFLRISRKTLYTAIRNGEFPARRLGTTIRISRRAVVEWLSTSQGRVGRSRSSR